jgi:sigma-E factor negative regulatory protein RseA
MKQNISMLMDGELCAEEADKLLAKIKCHPQARQEWLTYHLIGDALRQPDYMPEHMSAAFLERLRAEPTVLAPHSQRTAKTGLYAMSAAASIMAMAFLAWLSLSIGNVPVFQQAKVGPDTLRSAAFPISASVPANDSMDDYLLAHHEFSPSTDVRGASSYVRTVAFKQTVAGQ